MLKSRTRSLLRNFHERVFKNFFVLFRSWVINKNTKNECVETRYFLYFQSTQDLNKIKKSRTLFCRLLLALLSSFFNSFGENITDLSCNCTITECLLKKWQLKLKDNITLLPLIPQAATFGFLEVGCQSYLIRNHILLISKLYIYKSTKSKFLGSTCLLKEIGKIKNREIKSICKRKKKQLM